jgi:hypothetical protein
MADTERHAGWAARFDQFTERLGPRFGRKDLRRRAVGYLRGLMGRVERKNSWQLAEHAGDATACSGCWAAPAGTPTRCATTCGPTSSSTWASPTAS